MSLKTPLAFLSYAHSDDEHESGKLRQLAERLSGEVRLQTGSEFRIFIDRSDLLWGQEWKVRIDESLNAVTFLIPILTPSYFKSEYCRKEMLRFLSREDELNCRDLILPVYYVRCPVLDDPAQRATDELAQRLHERQYKDWRHLRHEAWTAAEVGRQFEKMASEIVEALQRGSIRSQGADGLESARRIPGDTLPNDAQDWAAEKIAPPVPPTVVVDAMYRAQYGKISDAIRSERAGTRILVRPGLYSEALVINKPLEIVGDGNRDEIVIEARDTNAISFRSFAGRLAGLTIRQTGDREGWGLFRGSWFGFWFGQGDASAVDIAQGRLEIEDYVISSQGGGGAIRIRDGAEPRIRGNRIQNSKRYGIYVEDGGAGLLEGNEILDTWGIHISGRGNPTLRQNRIHHNLDGISVSGQNAVGLIEDNNIYENRITGVNVFGSPTVRGNRIQNNGYYGVRVWGGRGKFESNIVTENKKGDWEIAKDCEKNVTIL
jgi:parallel beta-helix repeat protein